MNRAELSVGYETDVNTNSISFDDNAKRLRTECGEYILSPNEVIKNEKTGEITSYADVAITEQKYKDRKRKEYLQRKSRNKDYEEF